MEPLSFATLIGRGEEASGHISGASHGVSRFLSHRVLAGGVIDRETETHLSSPWKSDSCTPPFFSRLGLVCPSSSLRSGRSAHLRRVVGEFEPGG